MKRFLLLLLLPLAFVACSDTTEGDLLSTEHVLFVDENTTIILNVSNQNITDEILEHVELIKKVEGFHAERAGEGIYLFVQAEDYRGESVVSAIQLLSKKENSDVYEFGPKKHTCKGTFCSKCSFTFDDNNEIDGCACEKEVAPGISAYCEHSISDTNKEGEFAH